MSGGKWAGRLTVGVAVLGLLGGCSGSRYPAPTAPPAVSDGGLPAASATVSATVSATPGVSGTPLALFGCPITVAEVEAAIGEVVSEPQVGIPIKSVTENCSFPFRSVVLSLGSLSVLVFDAQGAGTTMWDSVLTDPRWQNVTRIDGLGDAAFVTGSQRFTDLFAVKGQTGLHIFVDYGRTLSIEQFTALAKAVFSRR
jgi:hypothetical protein